MRTSKWISPLIAGLGLVFTAQAARAGLLEGQPGACQPASAVAPVPEACKPVHVYYPLPEACKPVHVYHPLPEACKPVHVYVPPVNACEPVKACEPVNGCETNRPHLSFERVGWHVDQLVHATFHIVHPWRASGYATAPAVVETAPSTDAAPTTAPPAQLPHRQRNCRRRRRPASNPAILLFARGLEPGSRPRRKPFTVCGTFRGNRGLSRGCRSRERRFGPRPLRPRPFFPGTKVLSG